MSRTFALPLAALLAGIAAGSAVSAQTLERMQMNYVQHTVELGGTSPFYWEPQQAAVSVQGNTIAIQLDVPDSGFSVVVPWSLSVPLPALPSSSVYRIVVSLAHETGKVAEPIGLLTAWAFAFPGQDPVINPALEVLSGSNWNATDGRR